MALITQITDQYAQDERVDQLTQALSSADRQALEIRRCIGASLCFILDGISRSRKAPLLAVAADKEQAAYWYSTLRSIRADRRIHWLPDAYRKPTAWDELSASQTLQRSAVISKITNPPEEQIIISYPEALLESLVAPEYLTEQQLSINRAERLDADTVIEVLVGYGFERVDFVYEPGQFSIRGGIVDIFSYGNEWPYRIELFDDEIESIRTFDPMSQRSRAEIASLRIVPNLKTEFTQDQKINFLKILPEDSILLIQDWDNCLDRWIRAYESYTSWLGSPSALAADESIRAHHKEVHITAPGQLSQMIQRHHRIYSDTQTLPEPVSLQIRGHIDPQPSFNKNFTLLIETLQQHEKAGITNYLFTDNPKQVRRFNAIFDDLEVKLQLQPIDINLHEGYIDRELQIACFTDHQIFERFHRPKLKRGFSKDQAVNLKMLRELRPGDYVTHIDHGIGRYSGLEKIDINGQTQESVRLIYKNNDVLYVSINSLHKISKYVGKEGKTPTVHRLGSDSWKSLKRKTKKRVKDIAAELIKLYAKRKASEGVAFPEDGYMQNELEASFIYEDTPDQETATQDVKADMMKSYPMDRLICGDVGFGKTEIAIRAAFKAIIGGKQVAILVPTTILALQHHETFRDRLAPYGVTVDYVNRFRSAAQKTAIYKRLKDGQIDIIIGTHAILNKKIEFKDLGLLVIDEEQKFGVAAKEKLRNIKVNVDTLTLTATPIPRTLQFSLMAARDMSILRTPPPNRQPIYTERRTLDDQLIKEAIYYEVERGGQVFFVHNRVKSLPDIRAMIEKLCPDIDIAMAHGQMDPKNLEKTLIEFIDRRHDVLVCTNIIETGLDIPNANTIIINNAHQFGLSDLHQLRGRVGRSNKRAFCYLFTPPLSVLTPEARKRIRTIEEFSDLGSGFEIAMRDMDIRGAGNLLGAEQSGFISEIGYETYQRVLEEAIQELKDHEYQELFADEQSSKPRLYVRDVVVDTDVEMLIPDDYVNNIQERLNLYTRLDEIENEEALEAWQHEIADRFGPIPPAVHELMSGLRLRWVCKVLGIQRLVLKNNTLRGFFPDDPQSKYFESAIFQSILQYVSTEGARLDMRFRQSRNHFILMWEDVRSLSEARDGLEKIYERSTATHALLKSE